MQQLKGFFHSQPDDDQFTTAQAGAAETARNDAEIEGAETDQTVYLPIKSENSLIILMGILGVGLLVSLFANVFLLFNNRALAQRESIYVQQPDGTTAKAAAFDVTHREAEVIKNTAVRWMQLTFEWDNQIPGSNAEDQGYTVEGTTQKVPTEVYLASYLMDTGFRQEFLRLMGTEKISPGVLQGRIKSSVRFFAISDPRQVGEGLWEVDIVATRIERDRNREVAEVPMNRTITLKAIPPVEPVFEELEPLAWRQQMYDLLANGLVIVKVEPLEVD
ncbi:hypothetical protein [Halomicronema sp. CCY15110]|uniref:hypothetical protein n=1 Tax=Halomicronema sp. CCY15110 TaxID=2767773 RepID=UPI001952644D|nr:hypothetical protein [Halomicronema sp. CCY15110]